MSIFKRFIDEILPPRCPVSGDSVAEQGMLSSAAWQSLNFIQKPFCKSCGLPLETVQKMTDELICGSCTLSPRKYASARSALVYDDASRQLILAFKHGDQLHLTLTFTPWLKVAGADMLETCDMIVPVPLHWRRLIYRRYNQSALLARHLSLDLRKVYAPDILVRTRHTPIQGHLSMKERFKNVQNAFLVPDKKKPEVENKRIVLIDDVYTTGATVEESTVALLQAGAAQVDILTVARVSKPQ